jgi:hypothetical protein
MTELLRQVSLPLDASALVALSHVGRVTDATVEEAIRTKVRPHWANLDDLAKEVILLHALNTSTDLWRVLVGTTTATSCEHFKTPLALMCEKHLLEEITDEDFVMSANAALARIVNSAR